MKTLMVPLLLGLSTLGVAPAPMAQRPPASVTGSRDNSVTVQNNRPVPVTVYMEYGAFDRRLGIVAPQQTATLALPAWAVNQSIRLFVHPEGEVDDLASLGGGAVVATPGAAKGGRMRASTSRTRFSPGSLRPRVPPTCSPLRAPTGTCSTTPGWANTSTHGTWTPDPDEPA
jgi:hypothetical protein